MDQVAEQRRQEAEERKQQEAEKWSKLTKERKQRKAEAKANKPAPPPPAVKEPYKPVLIPVRKKVDTLYTDDYRIAQKFRAVDFLQEQWSSGPQKPKKSATWEHSSSDDDEEEREVNNEYTSQQAFQLEEFKPGKI
uniref:Uncharacterized protein n=1 Tax=Ditylenchus dipsaci TaxID=166011 RepID=A0A915DJ48_9BILA